MSIFLFKCINILGSFVILSLKWEVFKVIKFNLETKFNLISFNAKVVNLRFDLFNQEFNQFLRMILSNINFIVINLINIINHGRLFHIHSLAGN